MLYLDHMVSERNAVAASTRTVPGAAALPDFLCEFASALRRSGPDHLNCGLHGHGVRLALHAQHGGQPRAQARRALAGGIVLYREPADFGTPERVRTTDIATPARPEEIGRFAVFLMAVEVADLNVPSAPTERADTSSRRRAGVGAIPERPISDRFLTPAPPARRTGQSWSSSSSSSSSSDTMSRTESSLSLRAWFSSSSSSMRSLRSA